MNFYLLLKTSSKYYILSLFIINSYFKMSLKLKILPSRVKFLTYYYVQIGWSCKEKILLQVTDLTHNEIKTIKENWVLLYKTHILSTKEYDYDYDVDAKISTIENFLYSISIHEIIFWEIKGRLEYWDEKININIEKLKSLYKIQDEITMDEDDWNEESEVFTNDFIERKERYLKYLVNEIKGN